MAQFTPKRRLADPFTHIKLPTIRWRTLNFHLEQHWTSFHEHSASIMDFQLSFFTLILFSVYLLKNSNTNLFWIASLDFVLLRHIGLNLDLRLIPQKSCTALIYWKCCFLLFSVLGWVTESDLIFSELVISKKHVANILQVIVPFVLMAGGSLFLNQPLKPSYYSIILSCWDFFFFSFACAAFRFLNN